ncbi:mitogen-activated protein kinase kinase kinase 1b-like isoform X2 [Melanotaenia boesemani]|uniref:mitogen-activated protein kinase kinase kinase 1b-like isoform X2 n=2 Tax=Melanotaenia boesemani TaxID=1250792 RepID=UPI001C05336F|nr:mitogen-activated protein kinase kinase kinase 1b-like isoform X2 [Melanotaenia boesemani]
MLVSESGKNRSQKKSCQSRSQEKVVRTTAMSLKCDNAVPYITQSATKASQTSQPRETKMEKIKRYEELRRELDNGEITQKGFDARVKTLLSSAQREVGPSETHAVLTAAQVFESAKKLVKKKQFPLRRPAQKNFFKIRMTPMEWKSRTKLSSGRFVKLVLDEAPPRVIFNGHETYDDLVKAGRERFWLKEEDKDGYEYTLCHADGTRWSKQEFEQEHLTLSEISNPWKRTLYIGKKELEVVCLGEEIPTSAPGSSADDVLREHEDRPTSAQLSAGPESERVSEDIVVGANELVGPQSAAAGASAEVAQFASMTPPTLPSLYLPRVPFVDVSFIKYDEDKLLGEGNFGKVYAGSFQGTPAAVKRILCTEGKHEDDIQHEIRVSLRLSHPNVVRLLAVARTDAFFLLATEYIHGATLDAVLHKVDCQIQFEGDDGTFVALDLSMAIEYVHSQRVVHQDIKPANVMVHHRTKRAVLTDWGLANIRDTVILRQGSRQLSHAVGPTGGTLLYMAPECVVKYQDASFQTDVWSLGATIVEIFTGSFPWTVRKQKELAALMAAGTPPHALTQLEGRCDYLHSIFSYNPSERPTASQIVELIKSQVDLQSRYGYTW